MSIVADRLTAARIKKLGIKMPMECIRAARAAKLELPYACALLMMETGGGANVYGHDNSIFRGRGEVTRENYNSYLAKRKVTGQMQGVGPVQLTWLGYQDEADRLGGCWKPEVNMQVGFSVLRAHIARLGITRGFAAYNGSGSAAVAYGARAVGQYRRFATALKAKSPKPKKVTLPRNWWKRWVVGDTDCNRDLLVALACVARDYSTMTGTKSHIRVRQGRRTYAEQLALYQLYLAGKGNLAAKPGTSNHEFGRAADCGIVIDGVEQNVGALPGIRKLMRERGLCLPVRGENWHVERGSAWVV